MKKEIITICGKAVDITYCAASENIYERMSDRIVGEIDFGKVGDMLCLTLACILAAYARDGKNAPVGYSDLYYEATPEEIKSAFITVIRLWSDWYSVPVALEKSIAPEGEKREGEKKNERTREDNSVHR